LSHESLPDWRVEKAAITASKNGHEVVFAGKSPQNYITKTFLKVYGIDWTAKARYGIPVYWGYVKKQVASIIRDAKPDIVHAHNIFSAKMMSEFNIPFVYDDHEYWSSHAKLLKEIISNPLLTSEMTHLVKDRFLRVRRSLINSHIIRLWSKWEKEIVTLCPTITVSDQIATELKKIKNGRKIFVIPNFPFRSEVGILKKPILHPAISCTYAGGDGRNLVKYPNRNIDGFTDLFENCHDIGCLTVIGWSGPSSKNVRYTGYLNRNEMYSEMCKHSIGLIPWKRHWSHAFVSPNKAYEYAHAGLFVMCTDSFRAVPETLKGNCATFEDYSSLTSELEFFQKNPGVLYEKRIKSFEFAKENLIWEKNEGEILKAYQSC
jgi:glycosyltransferase involved in cell wall biosynthesis